MELATVENSAIPDPQWVAGFSSGEACFSINMHQTNSDKPKRIKLFFRISQHIKDEGEKINSIFWLWKCL